jgi:long-chain acyl-CoA synthetase
MIKHVYDILEYQKTNYPKPDAISMIKDGKWIRYSIDEVMAIVNKLSIALMEFGIERGDKIALFAHNRAEWNFVDFACQQIGAISVPLYITLSNSDLDYVIKHAECKIGFISTVELHEKLKSANVDQLLSKIISFDKIEGLTSFDEFISNVSIEKIPELNERKSLNRPEDCFTIIYTSGTTGNPKGVMLSGSNLVFNITTGSLGVLPEHMKGDAKALSFLPLCHIAERLLNLIYVYFGISIYHAESIETVSRDLQEVKPQFFIAVPRLLEKVFEKIQAKGSELTGLKRLLFFKSLAIAKNYTPGEPKSFMHRVLNKLVFSKWREALGGEIKIIGCGAAPLMPELTRVFSAADIPVIEAYGLTETSPLVSATTFDPPDIKVGFAGKIVPGIEVKIADDGEVLVKGPNIMMGYYKNEDATKEVIVDDWFHTGDIGELADGKYLKITDRKKEMFKTSGGKYIAPSVIENWFKSSKWIDHIMVVGANQKFPAAIIVPSFDNLESYKARKEIKADSMSDLIQHEKVQNLFEREVNKLNDKLGQWEKIKKFIVLDHAWSSESGELTPTMKLKRRVINANYETQILDFYK